MAKKRQSKNGYYDIGRNKTPTWTRFQPGKSGNPNGRPRKTPKEAPMTPTESELDNLLRAELDRELTINEGGKPKKIKARELVPRSQINSAIKGNSNAQRHVMLEMRELERRDAERAKLLEAQQEAERQQQIMVYEYMVRKKDEHSVSRILYSNAVPFTERPGATLIYLGRRLPGGSSDLPVGSATSTTPSTRVTFTASPVL